VRFGLTPVESHTGSMTASDFFICIHSSYASVFCSFSLPSISSDCPPGDIVVFGVLPVGILRFFDSRTFVRHREYISPESFGICSLRAGNCNLLYSTSATSIHLAEILRRHSASIA
jgi:hypothetical protein